MNKFLNFFAFIFCFFSFATSILQAQTITGKVMDENEKPIPNVKLLIDHTNHVTADKNGSFKFVPSKKLVFPFTASVTSSGFSVTDINFSDDETEIVLTVKKLKEAIALNEKKGNLPVKELNTVTKETNLKEITNKDHTVKSETKSDEETVIASNPTVSISNEDSLKNVSEKVFEGYKDDFTRLSNEILLERTRLEENNERIRDEITGVTHRLQNEKNLTEVQKTELKKYVNHLEKTLLENTEAFHKSQEKTAFLIEKLKLMVMEKDSINLLAQKRVEIAEKERFKIEKKFKRNLIVFSIITFALLVLAVVFYGIATKMRKHRKVLMAQNQELQSIKEQMVAQQKQLELLEQK